VAALAGDVVVEGSPRANPITHRHFDPIGMVEAFPTFAWTPLADGLAESVRAAAAAR
jgi:hypothetical protein